MSVPLAAATTAKYVTDSAPAVETRYRARFYFDPNSITMANNADHVIFYGDSGTTAVLEVDLGFTTAGGYRLRVRNRDNASVWNNSVWVNITDAPHVFELDWQSGTAGSLAWWIDGTAQSPPATINNSARRIDRDRLGAVANVDTTTNGTMYFDAFESRRLAYIGPISGGLVTTNIAYDYDPLYRLTDATYSSGPFFRYTYDAVGNRLTEDSVAGPVNYAYDIANRLTSVNGVTYTWDNNGNLLSDGVSTNIYTHANRLASVVQGPTTYAFSYNGLGDRLRQTVNGSPTNYTVDLVAGLTQVLTDGANSYLYGVGRIGEEQLGGWQYHLGDALGSVRQLTNPAAAVTLARSYEPFGDTLASAGSGATAFQFTGEARDGTGLTYLRARYLSSAVGRFVERDPWRGAVQSPPTLNGWPYVLGNPVRRTDASGLGVVDFVACATLTEALSGNAPPLVSVGEAIRTCQQAYDMAGWEPLLTCGSNARKTPPTSVADLFEDFICEQGEKTLELHATNPLTRELARSVGVHRFVRRPFYESGDIYPPGHLNFDHLEGLLALIGPNSPFTINQFIGSFEYTVRSLPNDRVGFRIDNATERASGSHLRWRHRPRFTDYLETLIDENDPRWNQPLAAVIRDLPVISILAPRSRGQTIGTQGGGTMLQSFIWSERRLDCSIARLPLRASDVDALLDIRVWDDFEAYTDPWYGD